MGRINTNIPAITAGFQLNRNQQSLARSLQRLMFEPDRKKVYPSYPMTHVLDQPAVLAEIEAFRDRLAEDFTTFDPSDVDEKRLLIEADRAVERGDTTIEITVNGRTLTLDVAEVHRVAGDIDGQIYARDFKLIDQSDMIVSYIPQLPGGRPAGDGSARQLLPVERGALRAGGRPRRRALPPLGR